MQIKNNNSASSTIHDSKCMGGNYHVEFDEDGLARVRADVGECLIERYPNIESADDAADDAGSESADSDESDDADADADAESDQTEGDD